MDTELQAINLMEDHQKKLDAVTEYLTKHPDSENALFIKAQELRETAQNELAKEAYEKLLSKFPDDIAAHFSLGFLLKDVFEDFGRARTHFEAVVALNPSAEEAHYQIGFIEHVGFSNPEKARLHYEKALALNPALDYVHNSLAILLSTDPSTYKLSKEHYEKAIELNPGNARAHFNYAHLLQQHFRLSVENIVDSHNNPQLKNFMMGFNVRARSHYILATTLEPDLIHPAMVEIFGIERNNETTMLLAGNLV